MILNNYKRLGDYIQEVNVRNRDLAVTRLVGLSIDKIFISSVANTIGTDMSTYKIIRKGQFACSLMQVSRDGKIPVAMLTEKEAIMSPAYPMFEVVDMKILLPEYLMMWFSRSEFDREASFYAVGGVRGSLTWEDFCDMTLPIPDIAEQQRIVAEYEALSRRIAINEQICTKLEETAQALYRKMFVDNIDPNNLPEGWRMGTIGELIKGTLGGDWGKECCEGNYDTYVGCIRGADIKYIRVGTINTIPYRYILNKNLTNRELTNEDIVIEISGGSPTQSTGRTAYISNDILSLLNTHLICSNFCRVIKCVDNYSRFIYMVINYLYHNDILYKYENSSNGVKNLDVSSLFQEENIIIPSSNILDNFNKTLDSLNKMIITHNVENDKLKDLQTLLLSKLATN